MLLRQTIFYGPDCLIRLNESIIKWMLGPKSQREDRHSKRVNKILGGELKQRKDYFYHGLQSIILV